MNIFSPQRNDRGNTDGVFRMEFPLMQWIVASQYKVFGNHLIITRISMFLIGLLSVLGIYKLLFALFANINLAVIGAWAFNFSPSFYYYTINPLPDNLALCFSIWGLSLFFTWYRNKKWTYLILSGFIFSLGALCKLPFILYFIVPFVYFVVKLYKSGYKKNILLQAVGALGLGILPLVWYALAIPHWHGNDIVQGMFANKESVYRLLDYLQHNLISTLPESLLNYGSLIFFFAGFYFLYRKKSFKDSRFILILALSILVLGYYLFEANAIAKVHDYYLFPFYPLLFMLVAYGAYNLYNSGIKFNRYLTIVLLLLLPVFCHLRMQGRWNPDSPGFNKDLLLHKTELRNAVPKDALVVAGNDESHFIMFYYIDKKGWGFHNNSLNSQKLQTMIEDGAEYIYTDSEKISSNEGIAVHFDTLILEKGTIKVYSLKQ